MNFKHLSYVAMDRKEINSVLHCRNNECGITIDCDINGARNLYGLFIMMVQKEK